MHAQPGSTDHETSGRDGTLTDPERHALTLLCEQAAIPLDQLARLLRVPFEDAICLVQGLDVAGCVEHRRFLARDYPWFWPSRRGVRLSGTGFHYKPPELPILTHRRGVNEVRIHLAQRAPEASWVCERAVYRRRDPDDHLPDAVFEIDGERHAIEVELSRKAHREIRRIIAEHSNRYDAVVYFCGRRTHGLLRTVLAEGRWPKLVVRRLPEVESC